MDEIKSPYHVLEGKKRVDNNSSCVYDEMIITNKGETSFRPLERTTYVSKWGMIKT